MSVVRSRVTGPAPGRAAREDAGACRVLARIARLLPALALAAAVLPAPLSHADETTPATSAEASAEDGDGLARLAGGGRGGRETNARVSLHDERLETHDGEPVRFVSDVLDRSLVVVNAAYTRCTTMCPVANLTLAKLRQRLGARMEREVRIVTLTVEPAVDTPARLRRHAAAHGGGPGWLWLTGREANVRRVLAGLGLDTPDHREHPVSILVGNPRSDRWTRLFGFPSPARILAELEQLADQP